MIGAPKTAPLVSSQKNNTLIASQSPVTIQDQPHKQAGVQTSITPSQNNVSRNTVPLPPRPVATPPEPNHTPRATTIIGQTPQSHQKPPPPRPSHDSQTDEMRTKAYSQLPTPPRPQVHPDQAASKEELIKSVYEQPLLPKREKLNLASITKDARSIFIGEQPVEIPTSQQPLENTPLPQPAITALVPPPQQTPSQSQPEISLPKKRKWHRIPVLFAAVTLVFLLAAAGITWYVGNYYTPQSQASTNSSAASTGSVSIITYIGKNSLDPDKKEQNQFTVGDPIQICIRYESQPNKSIMQIKLLREVDGGSQLEVISTRIDIAGTDTRCFPYTGVQAVAGKYTVQIGTTPDANTQFKQAAESKFTIQEKPNAQ